MSIGGTVRSVWGRLMSIFGANSTNGVLQDIWNTDLQDDYAARQIRYELLRHLYANTLYSTRANSYAAAYVEAYDLFADWNLDDENQRTTIKRILIKPLYNPTNRVVEFFVSHLYRGPLDLERAEGGAIPLLNASDPLRNAIIQIWKWSNWGVEMDHWSRNGAMLGDTVIRIVDDTVRQKVYFQVHEPEDVVDVELDEHRHVKYIRFEYDVEDVNRVTGNTEKYTYAMEIDKESFRTYKDGDLFAYESNLMMFEPVQAEGTPTIEPAAVWPNPYGFVPVVLTAHTNIGTTFGVSAVGPTIAKIDQANDLGSRLGFQESKAIEPQWFLAGVTLKNQSQTGLALGGNVWSTANENANATPLVAPIDIANVLADLSSRLSEIAHDLPETVVDALLTKAAENSGVAIKLLLGPIEDHVTQARKGYDADLVRAQQMAVAIAGERGYISGFDLTSYAAGDLDHTIDPERPVFPPDPNQAFLDASQQLDLEMKRVTIALQNQSLANGALAGLGG